MKQFFTLLIILFLTLGVNAQYIYNDFDANQNENVQGWPNIPSVVTNPDPTGVNTSPNVGEWIRSEEQWAHMFIDLEGKIDFSTGNNFYLSVWSPITCQVLFKLEDKINSNIFTEVSYDLTITNQWVDITFDFTGSASDTYDKIVIFLDFATTTNNTFYVDDIEGPEYGAGTGPKPLLEADVQDNFENDGWGTIPAWKIQDPELIDLTITTDPANALNHVADYIRSGSFEYTNVQAVLDHRMDLSSRNIFNLDVYFPSSNTYGNELTPTAAIKLQNSLMGPNAWMTQTEIKHDVTTYDDWVTLEFDFSAISDSVDYDQIVVQLGGEGHLVPAQFYFDNLQLLDPTSLPEFQEQLIEIIPNPADNYISFNGITNPSDIAILSLNGQLVKKEVANLDKVHVGDLKEGLYFVIVTNPDGSMTTGKFIKK